jgi:peptide deformylase
MAIRDLRTIGDPVLRRKAEPIHPALIGTKELSQLLTDLADTMRAENGIGIAAPQIGEGVRVALIEIEEASTRYPDMTPTALTTFINPEVTVLDPAEQSYWEGCLSVPSLRGFVPRPRAVRVEYLDESGRSCMIEAEGFLATVLQHELDHLDGVLFVDRVRDTTTLATVDNYFKYWSPADPVDEEGL